MLPRTLEPEVMDTPAEAADYDAMDHFAVNQAFVDDLLAELNVPGRFDSSQRLRVLDIGTGTALIPIELASREPAVEITAVDAAEEMLRIARRRIEAGALHGRIVVDLVNARTMPYADGTFDVVMSNSIVHHIPDPASVFQEAVRVMRPGGLLFFRDLHRPDSDAQVEHLVRTYAGAESPDQQQLFRQSLHAALRVDEVEALAAACGLPSVRVTPTSDRHWTLVGKR